VAALPPPLFPVYALLQRRDFAAAEPLAQQAARDFPDLEAAWLLWANALAGQARYLDLERVASDALRRHPSSFDLTIALVTAARQTLRPELAAEALRNFTARFPDHLPAAAGLAQQLNYTPDTDPEALLAAHRRFGQLLARNTNSPANPPTPAPATTLDPHRPLRVAILSADLLRHSVAHFLLPIARHWPRDGSMHLTLISTAQRSDDITQRFRDTGLPFVNAGTLAPPQLDALIRQHAIDLLIECNGPADGSRLSALTQQPATIQLSYCGYPAITGCPFIQHRFVDALTDPPTTTDPASTQQLPTHESLLRIDPCFLTYAPLDEPPVPPPPSSAPHHPRPITLGCFNQLHKLNAPLLDDWAAILLALPGSVLVIKSAALHHEASRRVLTDAFASRGIAADRIRPTPWIADPRQHLALYHDIDLALDTFPYHGTTTTCEALLMGVPVITRAGETHASRVGVSLLSAVNAPELIATDGADYRARAIALARDAERLRSYRQTLPERLRQSPLMDHAGFTGRLIATLRAAWIARCAR
jgi:protein O-GlcNAc transferase